MNILYLNNYNYIRGGAEKVFLDEADLMTKYGHTVRIFARKYQQNLPSPYDRYFPKEMVTDSIKLSMDTIRSFIQYFYSLEAKKRIKDMLGAYPVDLAHAHNIYGRLTTSVLDALSEHEIPVVLTLHDYKLICPNYKLMYDGHICEDCKGSTYYMALWNRCHKESYLASAMAAAEAYFNHLLKKFENNIRFLISPSRFLLNKIKEFGWEKNNLVYIPNFLSLNDFEPQFKPGNYVVYLGRLSHEKGLDTLIEAFKSIDQKRHRLIIVGDGPMKQQLVESAGDDSRIRFAGYLSGNALKEATQNALAVVVPSEWYENASISILEALAYGKPILGARIGGIPEMIEDGGNGLLFEPGNGRDLAEKLHHLFGLSAKQLTDMGKQSRHKAETEYDAASHYQALMDLYRQATA